MATATQGQAAGQQPEDRQRRRDRALKVAIATVVLLATVGGVVWAASWAWRELRPAEPTASAAPAPLPATPQEAVQAYLAAIAAGDGPAARALVVPASAPALLDAIGSDLGNVERLVDLSVGEPAPVAPGGAGATPAPGAANAVVVPVTYGVVYRNQISGNNGGTRRWVVLEEQAAGGWLVRDVRTTP